jgi:extradiol dioxygenase family protein
MMDLTSFRRDVQVRDMDEARRFYQEILGCSEGPGGEQRLVFNLYGHEIVCRLDPQLRKRGRVILQYNLVDGKYLPVPHCRIILNMKDWRSLANRLKQHKVKLVIDNNGHLKSANTTATLLLLDPSGNALELQSFRHSGAGLLRYGRRWGSLGWMPWIILAVVIVCCVLLQAEKLPSENPPASNFPLPSNYFR